MTTKFLKQSQETKKSIVPTKKESRARELIRMESAFTDVTSLFPKLDENHRAVLANVVKTIFSRVKDKGAGYTPFKSTPQGSITHPQTVVDALSLHGAVMPPIEGNQSERVTLNSISMLSLISKGSLASVNSGQQHMSVASLEGWRKSLAAIGDHNPDIEVVSGYAELGEPRSFLVELLEEWRDLISTLPLSRIEEWADEYSGMERADIDRQIAYYTPTHKGFMHSMIKVWREEYNQGKLDNYLDKPHFLDVLQTRTVSRRIGRGFHTMIGSVHTGMTPYNSRVNYPKTNFAEYKRRYSEPRVETGLTSEVLLGYCLFTGINPMSMLHWLAYQESKLPGEWKTHKSASTEQDIIEWNGVMHPAEYKRFHGAIIKLGLVSDQNRWAMDLLSVSWVYHDLPQGDKVEDSLNTHAFGLKPVIDNLPSYEDLAGKLGLSELSCEYKTPVGAALAAEVNVFNAHRDLMCLSLMSVGELNYGTKYAFDERKRGEVEKARNSLEVDDFYTHMYDHICHEFAHVGDPEDYMDVEMSGGKVVIANSYQTSDMSWRALSATNNFYKAVVSYLGDRD